MSARAAWFLAAALLAGSHVGYHLAGREPGTVALATRLVLVVLLFVLGRSARAELRRSRGSS